MTGFFGYIYHTAIRGTNNPLQTTNHRVAVVFVEPLTLLPRSSCAAKLKGKSTATRWLVVHDATAGPRT